MIKKMLQKKQQEIKIAKFWRHDLMNVKLTAKIQPYFALY